MLRSLTSAISGLQNFQQRLDVIGNNIANVNTTGFKSGRVDFADSFSQTLRSSSPSSGTASGVSAMQIGSGVTTGSIRNLYGQGAVARTSVGTDLAISGEGYFMVRDTISNANFATRAGDFRVDSDGYIITSGGQRVQGYNDAALTTVGDLKIDDTGKPAGTSATATIRSFSINTEGKLELAMSDNTSFVRGQILLQNFKDPQALIKAGNSLYTGINSAGPIGGSTPTPVQPGSNGTGLIQASALELSNVDLANEFSSMITAQRGFQATARVISTSDEMLQELVNLKR